MCPAILLVVQSNNAMFGQSRESRQQLDMARVAAVEHGRDVLVSSTSGLSAVIDPTGAVGWQNSPVPFGYVLHRRRAAGVAG